MKRLLSIALILLLSPLPALADDAPATAPTVLSIIPGQGAPGTIVTVAGAGFSEQTSLFLGTEEVTVRIVDDRHISFEIPPLAPGNYALYLQQEGVSVARAYAFNVVPLKPQLTSLSRENISFCAAGQERLVTVSGKNFSDGAQILFDGAMIRGNRLSANEMSFAVPNVPGGLHQVHVRNPEETVSGALGLLVVTRPEIQGVVQGEDYVNYYNLLIEGTNFQHGSTLVIDGKRLLSGQSLPGERDKLIYVSCNRMIYQRAPYDPSVKSFSLLVVNPSGEESSPFTVSAP
jgi:hypothetical protein